MSDGGSLPCQGCGGPKSAGYGRHYCQDRWEQRVRAWKTGARDTILDSAYLAKELSKR